MIKKGGEILNVLIIGGTKFIGPFVVKQLLEKGHRVALFNRGLTNPSIPDNVTWIKGDRESIENQINEFKAFSPDVVLDMIPVNENHAKKTVEVFHDIAKRIVAISSADVYQAYGKLIGIEPGEPVPTPSFEDSNLREKLFPYREQVTPDHRYYDYDKILVERIYMNNNKIPGTVLRLPMVYGPGDFQHRLFEYLKRINDGRPAILLDEDLSKWKTARGYVENVAYAITLAITSPNAVNQIFNVAENNFEEKEWVQFIIESTNYDGNILIVPSGVMQLDFNPLQHLDLSSMKIRENLGYQEIVSFQDGLRRTIEWENTHYPEQIQEGQFNYQHEDEIIENYKPVS
jgi:nucleoside-diphosphate-sugar epimerase